MPRKCMVKGCKSNIANSKYTATFSFPKLVDRNRFKAWVNAVCPAGGKKPVIENHDTVCIKHFEDKYICRYEKNANQEQVPRKAKVCLTKDAIPTLNLNINEFEGEGDLDSIVKPKRGSSGLANLQKARMRKVLRRERMKNLLIKRAAHKTTNGDNPENYEITNDYFLGNRQESSAEKIIIPLRITTLFNRLHDGTSLCKIPPTSIRDTVKFPIFNAIQKIDEISDKNPLHWSPDEAFLFIKQVVKIKGVAKALRSEDIDGEALVNLTKTHLTANFSFSNVIADSVLKTLGQLRQEIIHRYVNT